jgi:hypothetical protein
MNYQRVRSCCGGLSRLSVEILQWPSDLSCQQEKNCEYVAFEQVITLFVKSLALSGAANLRLKESASYLLQKSRY